MDEAATAAATACCFSTIGRKQHGQHYIATVSETHDTKAEVERRPQRKQANYFRFLTRATEVEPKQRIAPLQPLFSYLALRGQVTAPKNVVVR